ncbi:MAG TPA: hypothetical protein VK539_34680 [Myxococcaceae bacterium]|nr:hypothetical protein [Myxococcaceae bacterium]
MFFESGVTVLHIAERFEVLMPSESASRARTKTVEPHLQSLAGMDLFYAMEERDRLRRPLAVDAAQSRLTALARWIAEGRISKLMTTVLRIVNHTELVATMPVFEAHRQRCEARPAFKKALAAQLAACVRNAPSARRRHDTTMTKIWRAHGHVPGPHAVGWSPPLL